MKIAFVFHQFVPANPEEAPGHQHPRCVVTLPDGRVFNFGLINYLHWKSDQDVFSEEELMGVLREAAQSGITFDANAKNQIERPV